MSEIIKEREILLDYLERKNYLKTSKVREAMLTVDRRNFVRSSDRLLAYDDTPLRIGQGQTISAPHMVAMMLEELNLCDEDNLLEIGSGCGYHAAVASKMVSKVTTIERIPYIYELACENLEGYENIDIINGDGSRGFKHNSPYQKIMVTCGAPRVPTPLVDQLEKGGLMVIPVGGRLAQELLTIEKTNTGITVSRRPGVAFVPMIGFNAFEN
ncbi:MAG TPA: protein-L-isoaspartate O-methyltransferase [Candidatus Poseidoniia archaeon]|nr:protein-L-isoaspartate O-methyltransferase [Candidatus Poseidoniia archaeon]